MAQLVVSLHKTYNLHGSLLTIYLHAAGTTILTFNADFTIRVIEVPITDDDIVEHSEIINLTLVSTDSAVILNPSTSTIIIEDEDSKLLCIHVQLCKNQCNVFSFTTSVVTIGFNKTAYSVSEDAGNISVTVSVQNGTLGRDVLVTVSTVNNTALCESLKPLYLKW